MHGTIPAMERVYTTPLLDKLGIRPGMRVALIDVADPDIRSLIGERTTDLTEGWPEPDTDVVLLGADSIDDLGAPRGPGDADPAERRDLGRLAQGHGADAARRGRHRCREGGRSRRQQGRVVLGHAHRAAPGHPGRTSTTRLTRRAHLPRSPYSLVPPRCTIRGWDPTS